MIKAEVLAIGNEVVAGDVINTNAAWISEALAKIGVEVTRHITIPDQAEKITTSLLDFYPDTKIVIVTGGLGPTVDDFTIEIAAKTFGRKLIENENALQEIEAFLKAKRLLLIENQAKQALIPEDAVALRNRVGTAPGVYLEENGRHFFFLPGVPIEARQIFDESVLPKIKSLLDKTFVASKTLRCFGAEEAKLDLLIKPLLKDRVFLDETKIAFRVVFPEVWIKMVAHAESEKIAKDHLNQTELAIREKIGRWIYGEDQTSFEEVILTQMREKKQRLVVAESCTGGYLAHRLTQIPGASNVFLGGVVAYSNELKMKILGVKEETLNHFGAVSEQTAKEMAEGAEKFFKTKTSEQKMIAVSITGIAGPSGGTPEKPIGTVYIAVRADQKTEVKKWVLPLDRKRFKELVTSLVLNELKKNLNGDA